MKTDKELELLISITNKKMFDSQSYTLNNAEIAVLKGIWESQTYNQIAVENSYSADYLSNVVAPELYRKLSNLCCQRVTKKNCRTLLEHLSDIQLSSEKISPLKKSNNVFFNVGHNSLPCYPNGSVPLHSCFYVKHFNDEDNLYKEVCKPGALIRIKAPAEMGKTSLLLRILEYASHQRYRTVSLNLEQIEKSILSDLNRFLRWLCANISQQLNLESKLDEYWDDDIGSKVSCTLYIRNYILEQIDSPLVLALDDLQQVFEYASVAKDFLPLLRSWYEEAKRTATWEKLRLVVSHSTEVYIPLEINHSPFNVGLPIKLENFDLSQVLQLAQCYQLEWIDEVKATQLMNQIGGHPALLNIAFYYLSRGEVNFEELLLNFSSSTGVYTQHLQRHWVNLQQKPELVLALDNIVKAERCVKLEPIVAHKLSSLGLIELSTDTAKLSCELYRKYFADILQAQN
jgi:hypothetical protein